MENVVQAKTMKLGRWWRKGALSLILVASVLTVDTVSEREGP